MSLPYYTPDVSPGNCTQIADEVIGNLSQESSQTLRYICSIVDDWVVQGKYSEPMVWIGIYIAIVSLSCILAMTADLLHGFRNNKLWFPCIYHSLNSASITMITVTMKLPVDLGSPMPSYMDQAAKLGSLAFMCTMMANLMPSLASMDNKALPANVISLAILVITMIVNVYIQVNTDVISPTKLNFLSVYSSTFDCVMIAYIYMAISLVLLIIIISFSLTIPTSKEILEFKYQAINKSSLTDRHLQRTQMSMAEKLRQHVRRYWVMAETGSPQFVMASSPLSTATGVICVIVLVMNVLVVLEVLYGYHGEKKVYGSPYKWSILSILITQAIGVVVGSIAPILRCFTVLSFKMVTKWDRNHLRVFKVEKYWTQKLYDWKQSHFPSLSSSRRSRTLVYNSKNIILSLWIRFQKVIVLCCKVISLIPILVPISFVYILYRWKSLEAMLFTTPTASRNEDRNEEEDLTNYVLQIHDEMELAEKRLKCISNSMYSFILKAEKEQNNHLLHLLKKSTRFKGVENFDSDQVQPLLSVELVNSWSLPIVTLTCIAVSFPSIHKDAAESLLRSVGEGLSYVHIVEENLNTASECANIQKATMTLWHEVENNRMWLKNPIGKVAFKGKTSTEILKWFADKAEEIVLEINKSTNEEMVERLIASNSMYRIARTILLRPEINIELMIKEEQLFALIKSMIADILFACFTNIPRVITMKCHESVIEKREASVKVAAKLLGKTTKIIERLETSELPSMDHEKMAFIDEWRLYLKQSIP